MLTEEKTRLNTIDLEARVKEYLEAFHARDLDRCMASFAGDAIIHFHTSTFSGRDELAGWHQERFEADLRMERMEAMSTEGDTVTIEASATSKRLRAWKLNTVSGIMTVRFAQDRIQELRFGVSLDFW